MRRLLMTFALLAAVPVAARAEVKLPTLFTDNMVIQRDTAWNIWGTAAPDEKVRVILEGEGGATAEAKAGQDGKWKTAMPRHKAGGPFTITVEGMNKLTLKNVLFGDVWVCSGQSNMEWSLSASFDSRKHIDGSENAVIRLFTVPHMNPAKPAEDLAWPEKKMQAGPWLECGPKTVGRFSGVGYFFGRGVQKAVGVPVGLINSSWGGSPCEAWTPPAAAEAHPETKAQASKCGSMFNGMIWPMRDFPIKGVIWYQGESNAGRAWEYRTLFPAMIQAWRETWKQPDLTFLFVQLAPFKAVVDVQESDWAELREAQMLTTRKLKNTAMAVITDVGDPRDIHPKKKEEVGYRLALAARAIAYGEKIEFSGPVFDKASFDGNKATLTFTHIGKGLEARDGELKGFTVAGEDRKFHVARAMIAGDKVVVSCEQVQKPVAVRYGWADCPVVNLWNKDGLPSSPFRTDDFPMKTQPKYVPGPK